MPEMTPAIELILYVIIIKQSNSKVNIIMLLGDSFFQYVGLIWLSQSGSGVEWF